MVKELSEAHQRFLEALYTYNGNVAKASLEAGFTANNGYKLMHTSLRDAIIDQAKSILVLHATRAAKTLADGIDEERPAPTNPHRIKCAQEILDRVGISRREYVEIAADSSMPLFILPQKQDVRKDNDKEES